MRSPDTRSLSPGRATAALVALSLGVAVIALGRESLWFDETVTVRVGRFGIDRFTRLVEEREPFWGLYYVFMRAWMQLGDNPVMLRLPSAIAAALTVALTYLIGRRILDERAAFAGALILALHAFLLQYALEARGYAFAVALVAASTLAFLLAVERPTPWRWAAYALLSVAAVYAHFFAALVIGVHAVALVAHGTRWLRSHWAYPSAAFVIVAVATWPLASWLLANEQTRRFLRPITPDRVIAAFAWFGGANRMAVGPLYYVLAAAAFAVVGLGCAHLLARRRSDGDRWRPVLLAAWMTAPLVISLVISVFIRPVVTYRYLLVSLPAFALVAGALAVRVAAGPARAAVTVGMLALLMAGSWPILFLPNKPDWDGAARLTMSAAQPGDVVIVQPRWQWTPLFYALDHVAGEGDTPDRVVTDAGAPPPPEILDDPNRRVWLVVFDYETEPRIESYPFVELLRSDRRIVRNELFYRVRVLLFEAPG